VVATTWYRTKTRRIKDVKFGGWEFLTGQFQLGYNMWFAVAKCRWCLFVLRRCLRDCLDVDREKSRRIRSKSGGSLGIAALRVYEADWRRKGAGFAAEKKTRDEGRGRGRGRARRRREAIGSGISR
jgi:hypothetical protein